MTTHPSAYESSVPIRITYAQALAFWRQVSAWSTIIHRLETLGSIADGSSILGREQSASSNEINSLNLGNRNFEIECARCIIHLKATSRSLELFFPLIQPSQPWLILFQTKVTWLRQSWGSEVYSRYLSLNYLDLCTFLEIRWWLSSALSDSWYSQSWRTYFFQT